MAENVDIKAASANINAMISDLSIKKVFDLTTYFANMTNNNIMQTVPVVNASFPINCISIGKNNNINVITVA
jgi:hypothetical protein